MPKSVDQTVFDYFSVLLREPEADVSPAATVVMQEAFIATPSPAKPSSIRSEAVVTPLRQDKTEVKPMVAEVLADPVDKVALQRLLAPVLAPEATEPHIVTKVNVAEVLPTPTAVKSALVSNVAPLVKPIVAEPSITASMTVTPLKDEAEVKNALQTQAGAVPPVRLAPLDDQLDDDFQVLFFKVAGLTLAVPLISLGGIVQIEHITHIIGRPRWYKGVQTYRESQLNVVDTAAWVMPEKYDDKLAQSINYQYLVVLENSNWGLACESLVNAVRINKSQVNWRGKEGKRPWLAGVVKEQMCGILHVQALVEMLNAGLGCQDPID